ncbi:MAG TPA: GNAT family N-acetyltransferase [Bryobacteraceae bacterium]|nr:GNAT family N-acetyltransferase [Bryobacteraceae bacterium]
MRWIIERYFGWDERREEEKFAEQFKIDEARIIVAKGADVGWLQTQVDDTTINLQSLYVMPSMQRRGIGTEVLKMLAAQGKAITLGVVKINPAIRLYQRLGFRITHEDEYKFYMRLDSARAVRLE